MRNNYLVDDPPQTHEASIINEDALDIDNGSGSGDGSGSGKSILALRGSQTNCLIVLIVGDGNDDDGETEELKDLTWLSYVGMALILIALILLAVRRKTCQWKLCC